jgi:hypothetical protein
MTPIAIPYSWARHTSRTSLAVFASTLAGADHDEVMMFGHSVRLSRHLSSAARCRAWLQDASTMVELIEGNHPSTR